MLEWPTMKLLVKMLKQIAVYWKPKRNLDGILITDQYANVEYELPIEIMVRWEDEVVNGIDVDGREIVFMATVYSDRTLEVDGMLLLGEIAGLKGPLPPPSQAKKIRRVEAVTTLRAKGDPLEEIPTKEILRTNLL